MGRKPTVLRRRLLGVALCGAAVFAPTVLAEEERLPPGQAWYVVRPGDTMQKISDRFHGTTLRWRQNWKLNPSIEDPDRIAPGTRIRVTVPDALPEGAALLLEVSRRVEGLARPLDWEAAREADLLRDRDGVRTYAASSAELRLSGETRVKLTEDSLVFVGRERTEEKVGRDVIEIDLGQADLENAAGGIGEGDIEIVVGGARARPRAEEGPLRSRFRKPEAGGVELMVYDGASDLAAAGAAVEVPAGMGTVAKAGAAPGPPEKLLDAPEGLEPVDGAELWGLRPEVAWATVEGAASYTAEVCGDPGCSSLLARVTGLETASWTPAEDLEPGEVYTRVTAVAASGLDGYPSEPVRWMLSEGSDATAPTVELAFDGPSARREARWHVAPETGVGVETADGESGVADLRIRLDGEDVTEEGLGGPWEDGRRLLLAATATDRAGNTGELEEVAVFVDGQPPVVVAGGEVVDASIYGRGEGFLETDDQAPTGGLAWRTASGRFLPLTTVRLLSEDGPPVGRTARVLVRRAEASRAATRETERKHRGKRVRRKERVVREPGVWIEVLDRGAGVAEVELRAAGPENVEVVAVDAVGNVTRVGIPVP